MKAQNGSSEQSSNPIRTFKALSFSTQQEKAEYTEAIQRNKNLSLALYRSEDSSDAEDSEENSKEF
jgi:hypothetical protein